MFKQSFLALSLPCLLASCLNTNNSEQGDLALAPGDSDENFTAAKVVLAEKCLSCHSEWTPYDENDYIDQGLIKPATLAESPLIYRTKGAGVNVDQENMPDSGGTISAAQVETLKKWVQELVAE